MQNKCLDTYGQCDFYDGSHNANIESCNKLGAGNSYCTDKCFPVGPTCASSKECMLTPMQTCRAHPKCPGANCCVDIWACPGRGGCSCNSNSDCDVKATQGVCERGYCSP